MASEVSNHEQYEFKIPKEYCRLCLSEKILVNVFEEDDLHQWIFDYLSIAISLEDRMGQSICAICRLQLSEFHQYWIRCQEVQAMLEAEQGKKIDKPVPAKVQKAAQKVQCAVCNKLMDDETQLYHHMRNHGTPAKCKLCNRVCKSRKLLADHMRVHGPKKYACPQCDKTFSRSQHVDSHLVLFHLVAPKTVSMEKVKKYSNARTAMTKKFMKENGITETKKRKRKSKTDDDEYKMPKSLKKEVKPETATNEENNRRKDQNKDSNNRRSCSRLRTPRTFNCNICQEVFNHHRELANHKLYCTESNKDGCSICGARLFPRMLVRHMQKHKRKTN